MDRLTPPSLPSRSSERQLPEDPLLALLLLDWPGERALEALIDRLAEARR